VATGWDTLKHGHALANAHRMVCRSFFGVYVEYRGVRVQDRRGRQAGNLRPHQRFVRLFHCGTLCPATQHAAQDTPHVDDPVTHTELTPNLVF